MTRPHVPSSPNGLSVVNGLLRSFQWTVDLEPEALWPLLGDPARLDEVAGWPRLPLRLRRKRTSASQRQQAPRGPFGWPFPLAWDERPVEWVKNRWWRRERHYASGPPIGEALHLALGRDETSATTTTFTVGVSPRGVLG
ncbi:MAG: hypothetical protein EXQ85_01100 [Alphaproteobacteria bacterium]|nr:hypothetical protein [Alphaproteobacteria bacterium]